MKRTTPEQIADESLPLKFDVLALPTIRRCVHACGLINSLQRLTRPRLFACLIVRAVLRTTYRGLIERLARMPRPGAARPAG